MDLLFDVPTIMGRIFSFYTYEKTKIILASRSFS